MSFHMYVQLTCMNFHFMIWYIYSLRNVFHNTISSYQTVEISYLVATISVQCHFASTSMIINLRYCQLLKLLFMRLTWLWEVFHCSRCKKKYVWLANNCTKFCPKAVSFSLSNLYIIYCCTCFSYPSFSFVSKKVG